MPNPNEQPSGIILPAMRIAVPQGDRVLLVGNIAGERAGATPEEYLRSAGRAMLNRALSPSFGWSGDGRMNYITDPIDDLGHGLSTFVRFLYERRWLPDTPENGESSFVVYDINKPAVEVRPLPAHPEQI